jgi:hypothetical protein
LVYIIRKHYQITTPKKKKKKKEKKKTPPNLSCNQKGQFFDFLNKFSMQTLAWIGENGGLGLPRGGGLALPCPCGGLLLVARGARVPGVHVGSGSGSGSGGGGGGGSGGGSGGGGGGGGGAQVVRLGLSDSGARGRIAVDIRAWGV